METYGGSTNISKLKIYGFSGKVLFTKISKNQGESMLFPLQVAFLCFSLR
jgi:hypothetical protein